jgi:adenylosuccinate lyase
MSREDAYTVVQKHAMKAWQEGGSFEKMLAGDKSVAKHLDKAALAELFDLGYHLKHIEVIFARVLGKPESVTARPKAAPRQRR